MLDWNREKLPARNLYDDLLPVFLQIFDIEEHLQSWNCNFTAIIVNFQINS
jgi:hypothetical protein